MFVNVLASNTCRHEQSPHNGGSWLYGRRISSDKETIALPLRLECCSWLFETVTAVMASESMTGSKHPDKYKSNEISPTFIAIFAKLVKQMCMQYRRGKSKVRKGKQK